MEKTIRGRRSRAEAQAENRSPRHFEVPALDQRPPGKLYCGPPLEKVRFRLPAYKRQHASAMTEFWISCILTPVLRFSPRLRWKTFVTCRQLINLLDPQQKRGTFRRIIHLMLRTYSLSTYIFVPAVTTSSTELCQSDGYASPAFPTTTGNDVSSGTRLTNVDSVECLNLPS